MTTLGDVLIALSGSMSLWRDVAIAALAGVVIGALYLYASLVDA
jgi:hypothetical protein